MIPVSPRVTTLTIAVLTAVSALPSIAQDVPAIKTTWNAELPAGVRRIAVADVAGDGKLRLLALGTGAALTIYGLAGDKPAQEATVDLGPSADQFVAGKFAKDRSAIAAPGVIVLKEGDAYKVHKTAKVDRVTGMVRFSDGTENLFFFDGMSSPDSWAVDPAAAEPAVTGREMPNPGQDPGAYTYALIHVKPEMLAAFHLPEQAQKAGVFGFHAMPGGKLVSFAPWIDADASYLTLYEMRMGEPGDDLKPLWKSPKLPGKVLDMAIGSDPKTGKGMGLYVLQATGTDGKGRLVEYYAPEEHAR